MKLSVILIAAIQAAPSRLSDEMLRMVDRMVADWLTKADETFASDNWEQFSAVVDGVDQHSRLTFSTLFNWCNSNGDSEVSSEEWFNCSKKDDYYFDMEAFYQPYVQKIKEKFAQNYWHLVDQDNSESLNFDEYKYTLAGFFLIDAKDVIKFYDENANGILDGAELTRWRDTSEKLFRNRLKRYPSDEFLAGLNTAWTDSQIDGDENTGSQAEIAQFGLRVSGLMIAEVSPPLQT